MSYILDALKKSQRERPPGPVPDLFTVHGPQPSLPRRPTRAIIAAALFLVVLAISLWAWIGTGRREEGAARPPVAASLPARPEAPTVPAAPRAVVAPTPPAPARAAVAAARRKAVDEPPTAHAPAAQKPREVVAAPAVSVAAPTHPPPAAPASVAVPASPAVVSPAPATVPATPATVPASPAVMPTAPVARPSPPQTAGHAPSPPTPASDLPPAAFPAPVSAAPPTSVPAPVTSAVAEPAQTAPEQTPPADGRVLNLDELPATLRAELPKLRVSGHVWSEEPALRLLSVDDRLLHEGDEVTPGASLQEITPSGAVFAYKGWRFRVTGGRP